MATYISKATGNFSLSSTWAPVETGASAVQLTHSTNRSIAGGSSITSPTFTGTNTDVCDGVLLWLRRGGTTGSITIALLKGGVSQKSITVNNTDLPASLSPIFFKFASTLTFDGSSTYAVRITVNSGASTLTYRSDASSTNMAKLLRLTAAASAPAAGDIFAVVGELTGAGTSNSFTVTMDDPGTNIYGNDVQTTALVPHTAQNGVDIGQGGTLQWATVSGTYQLHIKGHVSVWANGTLNIGTSGTPMPSGVTGEIYFDNGTDVKFGLELNDGCTVNMYGLTKTHVQYLAADAGSGVSSFTLNGTPTNWQNGDEVVLASTSQTASESEVLTLNANVSTTTMTTSANSTAAHAGGGGTNGALVKAEVVNITRNVRIKGNVSQRAYVAFVSNAGVAPVAVSLNNVEFKYIGGSVIEKEGIRVESTAGTWTGTGLVIRDTTVSGARGFYFTGSSGLDYSISNSVAWNVGTNALNTSSTTANGWSINGFIAIKNSAAASELISLSSTNGTLSNITAVGATGHGIIFGDTGNGTSGAISNITTHTNSLSGYQMIGNLMATTLSGFVSYRNGTYGWLVGNAAGLNANVVFDTFTIFGNGTSGIQFSAVAAGYVLWSGCTFKNFTVDAGLVVTQPLGWQIGDAHVFENCVMESSSFGANQTHATADVDFASSTTGRVAIAGRANVFASATEISNLANLANSGYFSSQRHDNAAGSHKNLTRQGTTSIDTTIFDAASPSARLTPTQSGEKLSVEVATAAVINGGTVTLSVRVRKSVVGDGAAYNGNQPRLIVKKNLAAGISADTVLATAAAAAGSWETLSGTTAAVTEDDVLIFIADCDGTAGWINVDTAVGLSISGEQGSFRFWKQGSPLSLMLRSVTSRGTMAFWRDGVPYTALFAWTFTPTISANVTATVSKIGQVQRVISLTVTDTLSVIKAIVRALSLVTSTITATVTKQANKPESVTSTATASLIKQTSQTKSITSTATTTASLTTLRTVSVVSAIATVLLRLVALLRSVTSTITPFAVKAPAKIVSPTSTATPSITKAAAEIKSVTSTVTATKDLVQQRTLATVVSTVTETVQKSVNRTISVTSTVTRTVVDSVSRVISATSTVTTLIIRQTVKQLTLDESTTITVTRSAAKVESVTSSVQPSVTRQVIELITTASNAVASIIKLVQRPLSAVTSTGTASLVVQAQKPVTVTSTVTPAQTITTAMTRAVTSAVTIATALLRFATLAITSTVSAVIVTYKNIDIKTAMSYINDGATDMVFEVSDESTNFEPIISDDSADYSSEISDGSTEFKFNV